MAQPLDRVIDQMTTNIANFGTTVNNTQTRALFTMTSAAQLLLEVAAHLDIIVHCLASPI